MKQQKNNQSTRPLYVRVICWILIILMISSAIYYTILGVQALFSSLFADGGAETQTKVYHLIPTDEAPTDYLSAAEVELL